MAELQVGRWTDESWLYLAVVLDLFNCEIVGRSIKPGMTVDIVTDALTMAWFRRRPAPGLIHHSDRGSQYASHAFQAKLAACGMTCSMSRKGNCWDNAPTESFFNSLKNEQVHSTPYETRAEAVADLFDYIEVFYNRSRDEPPSSSSFSTIQKNHTPAPSPEFDLHQIVPSHFTGSTRRTVNAPPTLSARKRILSPALTCSSSAGSAT